MFQTPLVAFETTICPENEVYWTHWEIEDLRSRGANWNPPFIDIELTRDGNQIAFATAFEHALTIYDVGTFEPEASLDNPRIGFGYIRKGIHWSPDGRHLAAIYYDYDLANNRPNSGLYVWDVAQEEELLAIPGEFQTMDWSSDGTYFATTDISGRIEIWDANTFEEVFTEETIDAVYFDMLIWLPNSQGLLGINASSGTFYLIDVRDYSIELLDTDAGQGRHINDIAWSPDGTRIAKHVGGSLPPVIYNLETQNNQPLGSELTSISLDLQWSPNGHYLAWGTWSGLFLWDMTGETPFLFRAYNEQMPFFVSIAWMPDSQGLISADVSGDIYRWDIETGCVLASTFDPSADTP